MFTIKKYALRDFKEHDLVLKMTPLEGKEDVVGTKMLKSYEFLKSQLNKAGFTVKDSYFRWGWCWFDLDVKKIDKTYVHMGPKKEFKSHCEAFKKKYSSVKVKDGRLYTVLERKYVTPKLFVKSLLNNEKIKVKKIELCSV